MTRSQNGNMLRRASSRRVSQSIGTRCPHGATATPRREVSGHRGWVRSCLSRADTDGDACDDSPKTLPRWCPLCRRGPPHRLHVRRAPVLSVPRADPTVTTVRHSPARPPCRREWRRCRSHARPARRSCRRRRAQARIRRAYDDVPLAFVPNAGQMDARFRYYTQGDGARTRSVRTRPRCPSAARAASSWSAPPGRSGPRVDAHGARPGRRHRELFPRPRAVHGPRGIRRARVRRTLAGHRPRVPRAGRHLKYEFHVAPGADPSRIRLAYDGAGDVSLGRRGDLLIDTALGTFRDARPQTYQESTARTSRWQPLPPRPRYRHLRLRARLVRPGRPLVIDPGPAYSTLLGGSSNDFGIDIAVDRAATPTSPARPSHPTSRRSGASTRSTGAPPTRSWRSSTPRARSSCTPPISVGAGPKPGSRSRSTTPAGVRQRRQRVDRLPDHARCIRTAHNATKTPGSPSWLQTAPTSCTRPSSRATRSQATSVPPSRSTAPAMRTSRRLRLARLPVDAGSLRPDAQRRGRLARRFCRQAEA